jgi:hypothetical protein
MCEPSVGDRAVRAGISRTGSSAFSLVQTAIERVLAALGNLHAVLFRVGDIIHPRMGRVTTDR